MEPSSVKPEADDYTAEAYDNYLNVHVTVPLVGEPSKGKVLTLKLDRDVNPTGISNIKPMLDTRQYEVQFPSVEINTYSANNIAKNLYSNVDSEIHESLYLSEILEHRSDEYVINKDDGYTTSNVKQYQRE